MGRPMFDRILVPCDGTERTAPALAAGAALAGLVGGTVVGLCPAPELEPAPPADADPLRTARDEAIALAQDAQAYVRRCSAEHGVRCETVACADPEDGDAIVSAARALGCGLIVVAGAHHGGLLGRLLGDTEWRVMDGCRIPVLVVPEPSARPS